MITEIAYIGYPVTDMKRSRRFYEEVLGLKPDPQMCDENWVEYNIGPCCTLALGKYDGWAPSKDGACVGLEVDDFEATMAKLKAAGVTPQWEPCDTPACKMALITDPDGSPLMIHKRKA